EKIRQVRSMRNLSQEFMAGELRIDTSSYCRMEKGVTPITVERLHNIAYILRVSPEDLMDKQETPYLRNRTTGQGISSMVKQLEEEVRMLRDEIERFQGIQGNSAAGMRTR